MTYIQTGNTITTSFGITIVSPIVTTTPPAIVVPPEDIMVDIGILQDTSDMASVAGNFIVCESVLLSIKDGKYYLTLRFNPVGSMVAQNLRQQIDGVYQSVDLNSVTIDGAEYKEAEH